MSTTQQQKKKLKKTYEELLNEIRSVMSKTAAVFIPELCEALRLEHPELTNKEIEMKVQEDCLGFWKPGTIYASLPSWVHNQNAVKGSKKHWEKRYADELKKAEKIFTSVAQMDIPEAVIKQPEPEEELDQEMHELGIAKFGETDKSIRELKGDITEAAAQLFKALTQKDMPDESDDLIVDYIKPTREFRRSLSLELDVTARTTIYNWLHYTSAVIEDMMQIISEVKDK